MSTSSARPAPLMHPAGRGIVVPPRARTSVLLDALAPDEASPAFHLVSRGGFVVAALNDYWLDGVTPRGIEDLAPLATPGTRLVVPGIPADVPATVRVVGAGGEGGARPDPRADDRRSPGPARRPRCSARARGQRRRTLDPGAGRHARPGDHGRSARHRRRPSAPRSQAATSAGRSPRPRPQPSRPLPIRPSPLIHHATGRWRWQLSTAPSRRRSPPRAADGAPRTATIAVPADASRTFDVSDSIAVWVRPTSGAGQLHAAVTTSAPAGDDFVLAGLPLQPVRLTVTPVTVQPDRG
jgi:hypothetical protein